MVKTHRYFGTEFDDEITFSSLKPLFNSGDLVQPKKFHAVVIRGKEGDDDLGYNIYTQVTKGDDWAVQIYGGAGNDRLGIGQAHKASAGAGDDLLDFTGGGDREKDTVARGGEGADRFVFESTMNSREAQTRIMDFDPTEDRLGIEGPNGHKKDADWILDHARQKGDNVVIRYDTNSDDEYVRIVLKDVTLEDLTADVFLTDYNFL
jgi:peptidase M10/serralysin-like protein